MIDNQIMVFPKTFKEFADMFSIKDTDEVYSNGIDFIPVFRVEQWLEHTRKKGKWLEQDDGWGGVYYDCSICGESWTLIDGTPWENGMKFCPHCGAEMEVEK